MTWDVFIYLHKSFKKLSISKGKLLSNRLLLSPRAGKMFLVSSSTSVTTVTTSTYCYTTNTVTTACGKRRKRAIAYIGGMDEDEDIEVSPSKVREVESGEVEPGTGRDPRFVMYWMTTTSTSTSTSFSTTITLSALDCTPSGFALSLCG